ncbi:MAG: LTA synthase family protein [Halanaerobiales bacterium]
MKNKTIQSLENYNLIIFNLVCLLYWELLNLLLLYNKFGFTNIYPILVSIIAALLLSSLISVLPMKVKKYAHVSLLLIIALIYIVYFIYYKIFQTPLSLYSLLGASDAFQFRDIAYNAITNNTFTVLLFLVLFLSFKFINFNYRKINKKHISVFIILFLLLGITTFTYINTSANKTMIVKKLFFEVNDPDQNLKNLGLFQTIFFDYSRTILGNDIALEQPEVIDENTELEEEEVVEVDTTEYNILNIDFRELIDKSNNSDMQSLHKYFSLQTPTNKNKYTGIFEGHNLILITAEALHPSAISEELTPTLYKMTNEGFVFNNFYNPLWGVSTIDGEYVAMTGLLPKTGVWSLSLSAKNNMMYTLGNQLKEKGYNTYAYHNHTYSYYNRDESHPNLGYEYYGIGNGLVLKNMWPRSDLEMIEVTAPNYIDKEPFHTYYLTISGHLEYNFSGNHIAVKNKKLVDHLPYTEGPRAYLACNLELEFALDSLLTFLKDSGTLDNTVIAISPDHYPYGLNLDEINEISQNEINNEFDLYKSTFIVWKQGMSKIEVNKLSSSVDILPTLSNLFGLEYDSRTMIGRDILSDSTPLVIFKNHS